MNPIEPSALEWAIIMGAGLFGGFINTVAGGGSLLTLPALMLAGLPPTVANGTNRVGILWQSGSAAWRFDRAGALPRALALRLVLPTAAGATIGALFASVLPDAVLEPVILIVLGTVALLFALRPDWVAPTPGEHAPPSRPGRGAVLGLFVAGLYGGFLQAGVGFVLLTLLAGGLRLDLSRANALKVALVVPYTLIALGIFAAAGQVDWLIGLVLGLASVIGARLGVHVALTHTAWLRWLVFGAVVASAMAMWWRSVA